MYTNDLSNSLQCNPNLVADDTSLFPTVHNINKTINDLNNDLTKITNWAFQWKISLHPSELSVASHPPLTFNNIPVAQTTYFGIQLDKRLNFEENLSKEESKINKAIGDIRKLSNILPRSTICKSFISHSLGFT